jgi:hypothetical protein
MQTNMDSLLQRIGAARRELAAALLAGTVDPGFAAKFDARLVHAHDAKSLDELNTKVRAALHLIADQGPLGADFVPSFHEVVDAIQQRGLDDTA